MKTHTRPRRGHSTPPTGSDHVDEQVATKPQVHMIVNLYLTITDETLKTRLLFFHLLVSGGGDEATVHLEVSRCRSQWQSKSSICPTEAVPRALAAIPVLQSSFGRRRCTSLFPQPTYDLLDLISYSLATERQLSPLTLVTCLIIVLVGHSCIPVSPSALLFRTGTLSRYSSGNIHGPVSFSDIL